MAASSQAHVNILDQPRVATEVAITLDEGAAQRVGDMVVGSAAAITRYALGGFFTGLAFGVGPLPTPALAGRLLAAALAVGVIAFGRWGHRKARRAVNFDTKLIVQPDQLIIRHSRLAAPVAVPREDVRLVAVDPDASASSEHSLPVLSESGESRLTWLWQRHSGAQVPMLGPPGRAPNAVLLFNRPVDFTTRARPMPRQEARPSRAEAGLLLRVNDPAQLADAVADWDSFRAAVGDDLAYARALGPPRPRLPYGV